ncbi:DUF3168 domain-containing protein [Tistrella bauzanensis]|uniref:DUF3168 domain-containing protein n=1 Tax=Tistrella TaxID=171436 RepID=UPI0031F71994
MTAWTMPGMAVQIGLRAYLLADATLSAAVGGRVYDEAPDDAPLPWVELSAPRCTPAPAEGYMDAADTLLVAKVYADGGAASVTADTIVGLITQRLHRCHAQRGAIAPATITGHRLCLVQVLGADVERDGPRRRIGLVTILVNTNAV